MGTPKNLTTEETLALARVPESYNLLSRLPTPIMEFLKRGFDFTFLNHPTFLFGLSLAMR